MTASDLDTLVDTVCASPKYATLARDFVRSVGGRELAKGLRLKDAVKATKNKLHQVAGAYLDKPPDYAHWLHYLAAPSPDARKTVCAQLMRTHASTRERLATLDTFYAEIFAAVTARIGAVRSVIDLACGLNPLAIPWMPLADNAVYDAYDVYDDMAAFFTQAFPLLGVSGAGHAVDVTQMSFDNSPSEVRLYDLALIIKAIPCLQQLDKNIGEHLLRNVNARCMVVTYPALSLGGRSKGMRETYAAQFDALVADSTWHVKRLDFPNELAFVVEK